LEGQGLGVDFCVAVCTAMAKNSTAFADLLAKARTGGPRMWTPEEEEHAWCSVACPLTLQAHVEAASGASPASLVPLLPHILERLLGQPLDIAPWGVPVIRVERAGSENAQDAGYLRVKASVASAPRAQEGLFEISTPLGIARLRIEGLDDSARRASVEKAAAPGEDDLAVLLLSVPTEWLEPALLRRAWDQRLVDVADPDNASCGVEGSAWRSWLGQWGRISRLELSAHLGERETSGTVTLAATFAEAADCARCAAALGGGRLLVLQDPARAADVGAERCGPLDLEERVECAWQEHLLMEKEISRVDRGLVLQDLGAAMPKGRPACFEPLAQLFRKWIESGTLQAPSIVCEQRMLQERDANAARKPAEVFRQACWHSAFRIVLQIEPCTGDTEALTLALCEHWHKTHGICINFDAEDLSELTQVLQTVREASRSEEDSLRQAAEAEALCAEQALLQELEEEESRAERERRKKQQKKDKKAQRKGSTGSSSSTAGLPGDFDDEQERGQQEESASTKASKLDEARQLLESLCDKPSGSSTPPSSSPEACSTPGSPDERPPASTAAKAARKSAGQQSRGHAPAASAAAASSAEPIRKREADLETILAAVRKSEELHQKEPAADAGAAPKAAPRKEKQKTTSANAAPSVEEEEKPSTADTTQSVVSCTSSTRSTSWEAASCAGSSTSSSEIAARSHDSAEASDATPAASASNATTVAPALEDSTRPAALERPAVAGLSVDTTSPRAARAAWVDEVEDEESDGELDDEDDLLSPSSSPSKRNRRRRRRGGRALRNRAGAANEEDAAVAAAAAATPVCNGRRSVVTWGDLGLGVVNNDSNGTEAVAKASASAGEEVATAVQRSPTLQSLPPAGVATVGAPQLPSAAVATPSNAARPPDASSRCLSTDFGQVAPCAITSMRDASARVTPNAAGYRQRMWGDESAMMAAAGVGQVADCWGQCDASARYPMSPGHCAMGPMSPTHDANAGYWAQAAAYTPSGAPCGDASLRSPHHGAEMMGHGAEMMGHGAEMMSHNGNGGLLRSWLHASGLPSHGEDLAERLRAVAPDTYED